MQEDDYRGEHRAPDKRDTPMHDLEDAFPGIYGANAYREYVMDGMEGAYECMSIAQSVKGKPYKQVRVYRAVPINEQEEKVNAVIRTIHQAVKHKDRYTFYPKNKYMDELEDIVDSKGWKDWGERERIILDELQIRLDEAIKAKSKIKKYVINSGDWVTLSLEYAKMHGKEHLRNRYKIREKAVRANQLYTDGNDIREWGYVK